MALDLEMAASGPASESMPLNSPSKAKVEATDMQEDPEPTGPITDCYQVEGQQQVDVLKYLLAYGGSTFSYSVLQNGLHYFQIPGVGFIAYAFTRSLPRIAIVLADPMSAPKHYLYMIKQFLRTHNNCMFLAINEQCAAVLSKEGFLINTMVSPESRGS